MCAISSTTTHSSMWSASFVNCVSYHVGLQAVHVVRVFHSKIHTGRPIVVEIFVHATGVRLRASIFGVIAARCMKGSKDFNNTCSKESFIFGTIAIDYVTRADCFKDEPGARRRARWLRTCNWIKRAMTKYISKHFERHTKLQTSNSINTTASQRQTGTKRPLSPVHWSACDGAAESPGATLLLFLTDRQTKTEVLGQLVLRVQSVSEVDATHATVGVYLHDNTGLV